MLYESGDKVQRPGCMCARLMAHRLSLTCVTQTVALDSSHCKGEDHSASVHRVTDLALYVTEEGPQQTALTSKRGPTVQSVPHAAVHQHMLVATHTSLSVMYVRLG